MVTYRNPSETPTPPQKDRGVNRFVVPDNSISSIDSGEAYGGTPSPPRPRSGRENIRSRRRVGEKPSRFETQVGLPYEPRRRAIPAPDSPPKSPRARVNPTPRVWRMKDAYTGKPALAQEILQPLDQIDWVGYSEDMYVTGHANLVNMLDASHIPPRDEDGNYMYQPGSRKLMEKTLAQRHNTELPWASWEHMSDTLGVLLSKRPDGVEERLIWHVLFSLLRGILWLHHGQPSERSRSIRRAPDDPWLPIIHCNVNPDNIYLDKPATGQYYGVVKLGNLSRSITLLPNGINKYVNEAEFVGPNHPRHADFDAPELSWLHPHRPNFRPFGGQSDIWAIGVVCVLLMGGLDLVKPVKHLHKWQAKEKSNIIVIRAFGLWEKGKEGFTAEDLPVDYDIGLRTIVAGFLKFDPKLRPDAYAALARVNAHFERWCEDPDNFRWERWFKTATAEMVAAEQDRAKKAEKAAKARAQAIKIATRERERQEQTRKPLADFRPISGPSAPTNTPVHGNHVSTRPTRKSVFGPGRAADPSAPFDPYAIYPPVQTKKQKNAAKRKVEDKLERRGRSDAGSTPYKKARVEDVLE